MDETPVDVEKIGEPAAETPPAQKRIRPKKVIVPKEPITGEEEVVNEVVEQAKEVQRTVERVYFLSVLKRFGLAFGGILLFLGAMSATAFFLLFFDVFATGLPKNIELVIEIGLGMLAILHILAGLTLLAG